MNAAMHSPKGTRPGAPQGTRYGLAGLAGELDKLRAGLANSGSGYRPMLTATMKVAALVLGEQLDRDHAERCLRAAVQADHGHALRTFESLWRGALDKATPRFPRADNGDTLPQYQDGHERRATIAGWLNDGPCADEAITSGGSKGATALATSVYFAAAAMQANSTVLTETMAEMGERLCCDPATVWRQRALWLRHIHWSEKGSRHLNKTTGEIIRTRSTFRLQLPAESGAFTQRAEGTTSKMVDHCVNEPTPVRIDFNDPLYMPWHTRWIRRAGNRMEWRLWLALDTEMSWSDLRRSTGFSRASLAECLRRMVKAGEVEQTSDGYRRTLTTSIYDDPAVREVTGCKRCAPMRAAA